MVRRTILPWCLAVVGLLIVPVRSFGQTGAPAPARVPLDRAFNPAQPDFTVINLPTTLRVPEHKSAFRVTHRFSRALGRGKLGDLVGDLFGIDEGAQVGLEYRFGIMAGLQGGIYRTSDKTIEFFGQYDAMRQSDRRPVTLDVFASVEGRNNFGLCCLDVNAAHEFSPAIGVILSRTIDNHAAFYFQPIWIAHANAFTPDALGDHTMLMGVSARVRIRPTVYVAGTWVPRLGDFRPGVSEKAFAIEKRAGGHTFQLNFSNGVGTTIGQMARGAGSNDDWYMGFNISRKFF